MRGSGARVVIFSWNLAERAGPDRGRARRRRLPVQGAAAAEQIVAGIEAVHAGNVVAPVTAPARSTRVLRGDWPGRDFGLTARESEVLALITQGLSNQEIAERTYLSINSVKTYIRTAYRKIEVTRRSQAVAWGMQHGFEPDRSRIVTSHET